MSSSEDAAEHGFVPEAVGPSLSAREAAAVIALGVIGLLMAGLMPVLLGALADEHRLSAAGIGQCAMAEAFSTGLFAALAGAFLKPGRLRLIGFAASLALIAAEIGTTFASGTGVIAVRALAGLPQGLLIWIAIGMIARSETPERWAGVFVTAITAAQLVLALAFAFYVLPHFGANGGFIGLAVAVAPGAAIAFFAPQRYAPLVKPEGETGAPPSRGWLALFAVVVFTASFGAVAVYLQPLAHEAGLSANVARTALWVSLALQVAGGTAATAVAGRVHYLPVFVAGAFVFLIVWTVFALPVPAWLFVAANGFGGFTYSDDEPVPGADADRGRSLAPRCHAGRGRAGAGRCHGAACLVLSREQQRRAWRALSRRGVDLERASDDRGHACRRRTRARKKTDRTGNGRLAVVSSNARGKMSRCGRWRDRRRPCRNGRRRAARRRGPSADSGGW